MNVVLLFHFGNVLCDIFQFRKQKADAVHFQYIELLKALKICMEAKLLLYNSYTLRQFLSKQKWTFIKNINM